MEHAPPSRNLEEGIPAIPNGCP
uniref:Uncharacterized protein n=1 Tax=Anguilla anguilla TaxID=7936 RepID=A0A0E9RG17_ANGAN